MYDYKIHTTNDGTKIRVMLTCPDSINPILEYRFKSPHNNLWWYSRCCFLETNEDKIRRINQRMFDGDPTALAVLMAHNRICDDRFLRRDYETILLGYDLERDQFQFILKNSTYTGKIAYDD